MSESGNSSSVRVHKNRHTCWKSDTFSRITAEKSTKLALYLSKNRHHCWFFDIGDGFSTTLSVFIHTCWFFDNHAEKSSVSMIEPDIAAISFSETPSIDTPNASSSSIQPSASNSIKCCRLLYGVAENALMRAMYSFPSRE